MFFVFDIAASQTPKKEIVAWVKAVEPKEQALAEVVAIEVVSWVKIVLMEEAVVVDVLLRSWCRSRQSQLKLRLS